MAEYHLTLPLEQEKIKSLRAGDTVYLTGKLYTGRDAAHKRIIQALENRQEAPFPIQGETIYYVGPAPASPNHAVGSAGPTTSYRMDAYTPQLLQRGLAAMIGKGRRSKKVIEAMVENGAVYFGATGGAAALIAKSIIKSEVVAYPDLGAEAVHAFTVQDFPCIVIIDSLGNDLYAIGAEKYRIE